MKLYTLISLALILVFTAGCGESPKIEKINSSDYLIKAFLASSVTRISDPVTYIGGDLYEYINGGAELYHKYGFVEVATADYKKDNLELVVDIYKFADPMGSFGLYSMLRPADPNHIDVGIEGFSSGGSIEFTKGLFIIRIMSYEMTEEAETVLKSIASELEKESPGKTEYPELFDRFINENTSPYSKKINSQSFLGYSFLTDVYRQDYVINNDTFQVFLTNDETDQKFIDWSNKVKMSSEDSSLILGFGFDDEKGIIIRDTYDGDIITGRKGGLLVGIVNFKPAQSEFLEKWLSSLTHK